MNSLEQFQRKVAKALGILSLVHVPILAVIAWLLGRGPFETGTAALLFAAMPVALIWMQRPVTTVAFALAVALVGQTSLLVYAFIGHPWQVEMHFYYFAVLAMLSGFCDWRVLVVASALIALHHLGLNVALPAAVYPGGSDYLRVVVHAVAVTVETAMLILIGHTIRTAFASAQQARGAAENALAELEKLTAAQKDDLSRTSSRADRTGDLLGRFKAEITQSIEILHTAAQTLQTNANDLSSAAARAGAQSTTAAVTSDVTAAQVSSAANAGEELARTITHIGDNATQSSRLAAAAVNEAGRTNATIREMATVADGIGKVTDLISAIAAQTNLLALNATIEAARAGESGRGFAVVAQEVKALAAQTANATKEIASKIDAMQGATRRSVEAIEAISATIGELDRFCVLIATAVEQQAGAAREISENVNSASAGVTHVNGSIGEVEIIARQTSLAVAEVGTAVTEIANQTQTIRQRVYAFADDIRILQTSA